jgi:hypothetical protein
MKVLNINKLCNPGSFVKWGMRRGWASGPGPEPHYIAKYIAERGLYYSILFFFAIELKLAGQAKVFDKTKEKRGQLSPAPDSVTPQPPPRA